MAEENRCPECGADLPANAPQGLCPQCLMKKGLPTDAGDGGRGGSEGPTEPAGGSPGVFVPPAPEELAKEFGQLEVIELLGQGGMGAVYKARQPGLDRLVALKILPPQVGPDPAFTERFTREARALAKLNHPHIISVYDFGRTESGLYYFVMEFVDGTDLRQVIRARQASPREALAIIPQICDALQFAHEEGIVHRDIKPENILLDKKGRVRIADFGLAKLLDRPATAYTLTDPAQKMGTPHYMAPEQIEHPHDVDHRADIYSLGVVFYEMLTGELPLGRFAPPSKKVQVDVRLDQVVLKTLEKEPELRYQQASQIRTDVETICSDERQAESRRKSAGATAGGDSIEAIRHRVWIPSLGLLAAGAIDFLAAMGLAFAAVEVQISTGFSWAAIPGAVKFVVVAALVGYSILVVLGGWNIMQLRSHRLGVVGSVLGLLPISPGAVIGLPAGIWALYLLTRDQVKAAFGQEATEVSIPPKVREFAVSAVEEVKSAFSREKAEFQKLRTDDGARAGKGDTKTSDKSMGMAIASLVFGLLSVLSVSLEMDFLVRLSFGFSTIFLAVFMGVMALRNVTDYRRQLARTGLAVAGLLLALISMITLLSTVHG